MAKTSQIEERLRKEHGDLHKLIPKLASELSQEGAARALGVRQDWVYRWLRRNNYRLVSRYEQQERV